LPDQTLPDIPLPSAWSKKVKSAVLHVTSLTHYALVAAHGWAANSINARVWLSSDKEQRNQEVRQLREEIRIKDTRLAKIDPRHRPYYPTTERMRERFLRKQIDQWITWFNEHRPHTALGGRTPTEAYRRIAPANRRPRWEPRKRWPRDAGFAGPKAKTRDDPGMRLELVVTQLDDQKHLHVVKFRRAA